MLVALDGSRPLRVRTSSVAAVSLRYASTRVLHLDARRVRFTAGYPTVQFGYRLGAADLSSFGTSRKIGAPRTIRWFPKMAVNPDGAAVAAWHHVRRGRADEIQAVVRPAGGHFGSVVTLQSSGIESESTVGVAIDGRGRAVVAYSRRGQLAARLISTRTGVVSPEMRVTPPAGQRGPTEIAVGSGLDPGRFVVAWRAFPVSEGPSGRIDVAASVLDLGLGPAQTLATGDIVAYPRGPIVATVDAAGRAAVAWSQPTAGPARSIPYVAVADASGVFGAPQVLDSAGSVGSIVPSGESVAVGWLRETFGPEGHGNPLGVYVALGPSAPGELVDDRSSGTSADGLQPPGLGVLPSGRLLTVFGDVGDAGEARVSERGP